MPFNFFEIEYFICEYIIMENYKTALEQIDSIRTGSTLLIVPSEVIDLLAPGGPMVKTE